MITQGLQQIKLTEMIYFSFIDSLELGLYFVIIGYYFLIFAYFLIMRFRVSKRLYWLFFSLLFLALAISRGFFILYYFYAPETRSVSLMMLSYRFALFFTWIAISCLMGMLGIFLFPPEGSLKDESTEKQKEYLKYVMRIALIIAPIIIGIIALTLPDRLLIDKEFLSEFWIFISIKPNAVLGYPVGRFVINLILQPLFNFLIPIMFFYLAKRTFGVLRKSYALNGTGFLLYYLGRLSYSILGVLNAPNTQAVIPPLIILLSLLLIVIANSFEALK
ncbi:MAG: conserved membrane protein of unknown function [Promethearchaeota archaeon]|nr:MAG: conserved membrane protein of unknown function [Candidatus Lokiarchaeota archaeon]